MMFINTRPLERAKPLTTFLQSQGVTVLDLPLLELVACELAEQENIYLENLTQLNIYKALIFISETAVTYFFDFIKNHQISLNSNLTFIAVGKTTTQTFTQHWQTLGQNFWQKQTPIKPKLITPSDFNLPENNEGLLQLSLIQNLKKGDKILILKGKDGRALLKNTLQRKGITVNEVDFYQRIFPPTSAQIFQGFCQNFAFSVKPLVLITSLTAWYHWQVLLHNKFIPSDFDYLVLQQRIADSMVKNIQQKSLITVIEDLQPTTIFYAIQRLKEIL